MQPHTVKRVVDFIKLASPVLEVLFKRAAAQDVERQKVASIVPTAVDKLVAAGLVDTNDREKAAQALMDHKTAIEALGNFADYKNKKQAGTEKAGEGAEKVAGAEERNSDRVWFERTGVR